MYLFSNKNIKSFVGIQPQFYQFEFFNFLMNFNFILFFIIIYYV